MEGYIPKEKRKKILLMSDDIRMTSGISTVAREIVLGTSHVFNWVNLGGAINHIDQGKKLDLSDDTNKQNGIKDSSVIVYPISGYGNPDILRQILTIEKPDALMFITDPRYWMWLFQMEHEIRQKIPMIYLNIWDDLPYPMYNKSYYESCDALFAISKQTENINRVVLGEEIVKEKVIKYIPHGINEKYFFPITKDKPEYLALKEFKNKLYGTKTYDFNLLFNARNIRRKSIPDLMLAWKFFIDSIPDNQTDKCVLTLHTHKIDENGTNLEAVKEMLFGNNKKYNIVFSQGTLPVQGMNILYNTADAVILISSNEGWGLSLTEGMMCGKPIIANVTGGMQDQLRFEDENGEWLKLTPTLGSNHRKKYTKCGRWAFPVFPNNISLVGSVPTPYIFDDRADPQDISTQIRQVYNTKMYSPQEYEQICEEAQKWVHSDESMMSSRLMCRNIIEGINETFEKFQPRYKFELIKIEEKNVSKHFF